MDLKNPISADQQELYNFGIHLEWHLSDSKYVGRAGAVDERLQYWSELVTCNEVLLVDAVKALQIY